MRAFLDTSVLVATFYAEHECHEPSFALFLRQKKQSGCTAAHCLAEVYSVTTRMPGKDRASPDEALLFVDDIRERLSIVALDPEEYLEMLKEAAAHGILGGGVYDALAARCAIKAKAEAIYTWNAKHFQRLGTDIEARIKTP
ncbi:MAG: PIN domain-containing protein [Acidobacteriaceae bacterium]|nr:PIN domain-containing protein [Acidobacteriaceae bacterium]MBV9781385.1 PIN domain-containing protein [Acidobacteriaceae bacterium]